MRGAFALIALFGIFLSCLAHSALRVEQLKSRVDPSKADDFAIPLIVGSPTIVALRINNWIQYTQAGLTDGKFEKSPFENIDSTMGTKGLSYSVLAQTPQYLSLELRNYYEGAYSSSSDNFVVFDLQSGDKIELADLLTPTAMGRFDKRMLRKRLSAIDELLKQPDRPPSEPGKTDGHEESETQRDMYKECRAHMVSGEMTRNDFYLADGKLTVLQGCDFPHVIMALDDLGDLPYSETFEALGQDLTPYGHCLLVSLGTECGLRAASGLHPGFYVGKIDGDSPISLMIFGDGQPFYYYDRYNKHIALTFTRLGGGHILLKSASEGQIPEVFDLKIGSDSSLSGTWSRGSSKKFSVELH